MHETAKATPDGSPSAARLRLDRVVAFTAFLLLGAMTLATPFSVGISGMRTTGCIRACDFSLVGVGGGVIVVGCTAVTVVAFAALLLLPRSGRYLWWLPCSALAVAIGIVLLGTHLIDLGAGA